MKALALLSGGLDSILAIKMMLDQNIEVIALNSTSPFCTCTAKNSTCSAAASAAKQLGVPLKVFSKGLDYFKIVETPKFGYGTAMNPCIDCRIYLLRRAKEIMAEVGADFIVSGEVTGQRPMSQKKHTLICIEREAGVEDILLRPLSAKLMKPTLPERMGWVDREKLKGISGRGRKQQFALAGESGITDYPCPAGGCLLTDRHIARRLRDLFAHNKNYTMDDIRLLRTGRHFRITPVRKIVVTRNFDEVPKLLAGFNPETDLLVESVEPKGQVVLMRNSADLDEITAGILHYYSDADEASPLRVKLSGTIEEERMICSELQKPEFEAMKL